MENEQPISSEKIEALYYELREQLARNDDEAALRSSVQRLQNEAKPNVSMDLLAPYLFVPPSDDVDKLSNGDALHLLSVLVRLDGPNYLKPASRSVKMTAQLLAMNDAAIMYVSVDLLSVFVSQLEGVDVEVAVNAAETVVACCRKLSLAVISPVMTLITKLLHDCLNIVDSARRRDAGTICVRCASLAVDVAILDDLAMQSVLSSGVSDLWLGMVNNIDDPLLQMSTLDLIEKLAATKPMHPTRAQWLFSDPVVRPILALAGGSESDAVADAILGGPALRVIANLCGMMGSSGIDQVDHALLTGFHHALHNFESSSELDRLAVLDAISHFGCSSAEALDLVLDDTITREAWLSLSVAQPKLKSAIIFSVSMGVDPSRGQDGKNESNTSKALPGTSAMKLFSMFGRTNGQDAADLTLTLAKSPLPEVRLGAYTLLNSVCKISTGAQLLLSHQDFFSFLMNRERETTKEGREAKHDIVRTILNSSIRSLLADDIVSKLDKHLSEGAHYVMPQRWELATEQ